MIIMKRSERNHILAGNYQMLDSFLAVVERDLLLSELKYDEMLERKNVEIIRLKQGV